MPTKEIFNVNVKGPINIYEDNIRAIANKGGQFFKHSEHISISYHSVSDYKKKDWYRENFYWWPDCKHAY